MAKLMHATEWLWDGDIGEETFKRRLADVELSRSRLAIAEERHVKELAK
jgi:hypothetical protein